ncbi:MAG TPA: polysaccharide deacetylase family protein [Coleofasciculaceae cyanobacterium]
MKPTLQAKHNRIASRLWFVGTLIAATCSFVIGMSWSIHQQAHQPGVAKVSAPQSSPLVSTQHQPVSNPGGSEPWLRREGKPTSKATVIQPNRIPKNPTGAKAAKESTSPPVEVHTSPDTTTTPPSLNTEIRGDNANPLMDALPEPLPTEDVSPDIMTEELLPMKTFEIPAQFRGKVINHVTLSGSEKVIALTFDDGPWPNNTLQILDILKQYNINATFFWVGQCLKAYPQIAKQVVDDDHVIGNHTWHHSYRHFNKTAAAKEIEDTAELIYKTTGVKTSLFRPPGGVMNNGVVDYAKQQNYAIIMWSSDPMDYRHFSPQQLVNNVIRKAKPGAIVLMHDGGGNRHATVQALPQIITKLQEQGYRFVTVPELLEMKDQEQMSENLTKTGKL